MTRARSSRPVVKRGRGKSFAELQAGLLRARPVLRCARCGDSLCDCRDSEWLGLAPTPPDAGAAE